MQQGGACCGSSSCCLHAGGLGVVCVCVSFAVAGFRRWVLSHKVCVPRLLSVLVLLSTSNPHLRSCCQGRKCSNVASLQCQLHEDLHATHDPCCRNPTKVLLRASQHLELSARRELTSSARSSVSVPTMSMPHASDCDEPDIVGGYGCGRRWHCSRDAHTQGVREPENKV